MDAADTHLQAPGVGFALKQYHKLPFSPKSPVRKYHLGIYTSLTFAQEAAQQALQCTLSKLIDEGYHGRYCKDIDLDLRGLVTVYADTLIDGNFTTQEYWLSEFLIGTIEVWDPSWDAEVHRASEAALFNGPCSGSSADMQDIRKPVVRLPVVPKPTTPKPSPTDVPYPEELHWSWSGTRPPLPLSTTQLLPEPILPASGHEEELRLEWSQTRPS